MTPRQQIKSLSVTSDPITAGLSQEMDMLLDDDRIVDARTHCHVFLDCIWSRRKPVQGTMGRSEVWRWSRITWSCLGGMEDRKMIAVMAAWWSHREETQGRAVE